MKKADIITLIRCHVEHDNPGFRSKALEIANEFSENGDKDLALYITSLFTNANIMVPQSVEPESEFFKKTVCPSVSLFLPDKIRDDILGIVNAVARNIGVNKFLFYGSPGSGKTESAHQVARLLDRDLCVVNFNTIIDSRLGQTAKNIALLFGEINAYPFRNHTVFLFDEIDSLALDRINSNDLREMGRATSEFLKGMDSLNAEAVVIATTNLFNQLDKALIRRFDSSIDFDRYSQEDLLDVATNIYNDVISKIDGVSKNTKLFQKIVTISKPILYPGPMRNLIFSSIAFSSRIDDCDYFRRLLKAVDKSDDAFKSEKLIKEGFTLREIAILNKTPKSTVGRQVKKNAK